MDGELHDLSEVTSCPWGAPAHLGDGTIKKYFGNFVGIGVYL
jgi:hypothetical protein